MIKFVNKYLSLKVLIALAAILTFSFTGLCFIILNKQNILLGDMSSSVKAKLKQTSEIARKQFNSLEDDVNNSLLTASYYDKRLQSFNRQCQLTAYTLKGITCTL